MSFGYVNEGSAVMRGPMVTQLLDQFLSLTNWGPLDYLILDMPPGTGDIQLTLSQRLNITAAVIVTTPQELSFVDVERGVEMFDTVNVPCIAVVENMAYYVKDKAENVEVDYSTLREKFLNVLKGRDDIADEVAEDVISSLVDVVQESVQNTAKGETEEIRIFGPGHRRRLSEQWGIEHTFSIPLVSTIAKNGDSGTPFILGNPSSPQADTYRELAKVVARETSKVLFSTASRPNLSYLSEAQVIQVEGVDQGTLSPAELRRECRCAACVEELTGKQILNPESISDSIRPTKMSPTGNYAVSIDWSDGHRSLYPYRQIRSLLASKNNNNKEEVVDNMEKEKEAIQL